jgi:FAD/FMN-containing dehydrogenase
VITELSASQWDGELLAGDAVAAGFADDFGHVSSHEPAAVLRAGSIHDVAALLRFAAAHGVPVAARGMGHSTFGQSQVAGGIVVDLRGLAVIGPIEGDSVTVGAGASWRDVVTATAAHGLTPPVLTDYLGLSVGGTLSVGGIGGTSWQHGLQTDHVLALEVVTADGGTHRCSPDSEPELFATALAGLGQFGIITAATLRLVPAPARVRRHQLYYPDIATLTADQRVLLREGRFPFLQGEILPGETGWRYLLDVAEHDPADGDPLAGLSDDRPVAETEDVEHIAFADRLAAGEAYLRSTGEWLHPHPWWNALLPDRTTDEFLASLMAELTPHTLGASGLVLCYPIHTDRVRTPMFPKPAEPVAFLVGILRTSQPDTAAVEDAVAGNRRWYERARALGGVAYQIGTIPFTQQDWRAHFGPLWPAFAAAKRSYDPAGLLSPGHGIWAAPPAAHRRPTRPSR